MSNIIKSLQWRYATKLFDEHKHIPETELVEIYEAIRLSASSFGLQHYKIINIEDKATRETLRKFSWDQPQITDASHLFIFCSKTTLTDNDIAFHLDNIAKTRNQQLDSLIPYQNRINGFIENYDIDKITNWLEKQLYIVLGNIMSVCALKKIDTCPIEGFEPQMYDNVLKLPEKGLKSVFVLALGYRSKHDKYQFVKKVRKDASLIFETI